MLFRAFTIVFVALGWIAAGAGFVIGCVAFVALLGLAALHGKPISLD